MSVHETDRLNLPPKALQKRNCNAFFRFYFVLSPNCAIFANKTKGDGHKNKSPNKSGVKKIPKDQWIVVENRHEAVKTQDEHDKILIGIQRNSVSPYRRSDHYYPLKGLVKCGLCGYGLPLEYKRGKELIVKKCWHKDCFGNKCPNASGKAQYIIDAIDEQLKEYEDQIKADSKKFLEIFIKISWKIFIFYFFIFYFCLIFINNKIPTKIIGNDNHCPILTTYECPKIPTSGSLKNSVINRKTP